MSLFIAKILGPCLLVLSISFIVNRDLCKNVIEEYTTKPAFIFLGGIFALLVGLVLTINHNRWVADWPVIITIYGWGGITKGIWLLVFPDSMRKMGKYFQKNKALATAHLIIVFVFGVILSLFGYFGS